MAKDGSPIESIGEIGKGTTALDANAFRALRTLKESGLVGVGDDLIVASNVQVELARHGIAAAADVAAAGVRAVPAQVGF